MYAFGQGVEKDLNKAYSYWSRAAEKHLGTAMYNIATLHMTGQGDFKKGVGTAASWYKRAAEHRHFQSMLTLSSLYVLGESVEKDRIRALAWGGLAASNAPSQEYKQTAISQLRKISDGMSKEDISQAQALSNELVKVIDANVRKYKAQ